MEKKGKVRIFILLCFLLVTVNCLADPITKENPLDEFGGHKTHTGRDNEEYKGEFVIYQDNFVHAMVEGEIWLFEGFYHYHWWPTNNGWRPGVYIPSKKILELIEEERNLYNHIGISVLFEKGL